MRRALCANEQSVGLADRGRPWILEPRRRVRARHPEHATDEPRRSTPDTLDTGQLREARLVYVGKEQVAAAGQACECTHYKLTGGFDADLWYDAGERLVRQDWIEDGHPTRLELARVDR